MFGQIWARIQVSSHLNLSYSLVGQTVKNLLQYRRPRFHPWVGKILWRREWQPTPIFSFTFIKRVSSVYLSFPVSSSPSAVIPGSVCCAGRGAGPGLPLGTHLPAFLLLPHFALVSEPLKPQELGPTCQGHGVSGAGVCAHTNSDTDCPRTHTVGPVFCCPCNC